MYVCMYVYVDIYIKQKRSNSNKILLLRPIGITYLKKKNILRAQIIRHQLPPLKKYRVNEGKENSSNICS